MQRISKAGDGSIFCCDEDGRLEFYIPVTPDIRTPPESLKEVGPGHALEVSSTGEEAKGVWEGKELDVGKFGVAVVLSPAPRIGKSAAWYVGFKNTGYIYAVVSKLIKENKVGDKYYRSRSGVGYLGEYNSNDPHNRALLHTWSRMIARCYDKRNKDFLAYGGTGVHVCEDWHCYANFQREAKLIPHWEDKARDYKSYSIDKDIRSMSNIYSLDTCMWSPFKAQTKNTVSAKYFTAEDPEGNERVFASLTDASTLMEASICMIHRTLRGLRTNTVKGWTNFSYLTPPEGKTYTYFSIPHA